MAQQGIHTHTHTHTTPHHTRDTSMRQGAVCRTCLHLNIEDHAQGCWPLARRRTPTLFIIIIIIRSFWCVVLLLVRAAVRVVVIHVVVAVAVVSDTGFKVVGGLAQRAHARDAVSRCCCCRCRCAPLLHLDPRTVVAHNTRMVQPRKQAHLAQRLCVCVCVCVCPPRREQAGLSQQGCHPSGPTLANACCDDAGMSTFLIAY
jgi:hypothetical protein